MSLKVSVQLRFTLTNLIKRYTTRKLPSPPRLFVALKRDNSESNNKRRLEMSTSVKRALDNLTTIPTKVL